MKAPTERFSDRVENYIKYRPLYPSEVLDFLKQSIGLTPNWIIADIGSGTGILSKLFLANGNLVYAVEPNPEMRAAAEHLLATYPTFKSIQGQAEQTSLDDHSIHCITVGQAFHWFDQVNAKVEFLRILQPKGWVVIVWNDRKLDSSPFLAGYEQLLETYAQEYKAVKSRNVSSEELMEFYKPGHFQSSTFTNEQSFDFEGLCGRMLSSSYVPNIGQPGHQEILNALHELFHKYQVNNKVTIEYETSLYVGQCTLKPGEENPPCFTI
ncbi:MAG: class I SAM-dependent methyltransferase [Thermosynechococcaceae cyanobacterium]